MAETNRDTGAVAGDVCCAAEGKNAQASVAAWERGAACRRQPASPSSAAAYKELVDLHEAIRRTIAWEQSNPPGAINPQQFDYKAEDAALAGRG